MINFDSLRRIREEYREISRNLIPNLPLSCSLQNDDDIRNWICVICCPYNTPYKGGVFYANITFPQDYPNVPPKVRFITPIYHVNVSSNNNSLNSELGKPNLNILNFWKPEYKVKDVLISIHSLFYMNNISCSFSPNMADELRNNKALYEDKIKYFTRKYARPERIYNSYINLNEWDFSYNI